MFKINVDDYDSEIDLSHIKEQQAQSDIREIISSYKPEKIKDVGIKTKIILKDDIPVIARPRRLSPIEKETVNAIMNEWCQEGIIRVSKSEYASPIVLVKKKRWFNTGLH